MPATSSNSKADRDELLLRPSFIRSWAAVAVLALTLTGCSSSDLGDAEEAASASGGRQLSFAFDGRGFFRAGNVAGLEFVAGTRAGITDATGAFICDEGERISFSIGAVTLGDTACASVAHAAALTASRSPTDPAALNIMRFLMMLDQDENPNNGIAISESVRVAADSWSQIDFSAEDFENELLQVISDIASIEGRIASVPDDVAAFVLLDAGLSCAYSGVFFNRFHGDSGDVPISLSLRIFGGFAGNENVGELVMIRQDPFLPLYLESTGTVTLDTFSSVDSVDFSAEFITSDTLMGSWQNAQTVQAVDRMGSFDAIRLGGTSGEYRFVGNVERENTLEPGRQLLSRFELALSGDTLSGQAFDLLLGVTFPITGRRIAGSNDFEIEVSQLGSATVMLVPDVDGEPVGLTGGWPNFEGNVVEAVGCRLM